VFVPIYIKNKAMRAFFMRKPEETACAFYADAIYCTYIRFFRRLNMSAMERRMSFAGLFLTAAMLVFSGCELLGIDIKDVISGGGAESAEGPFALGGLKAGGGYVVGVYEAPEGDVSGAEAWAEATRSGRRVGHAAWTAAGAKAALALKAVDGGAVGDADFAGSGAFLVTVKETDGDVSSVKYKTAEFADGEAVLNWKTMAEAPGETGAADEPVTHYMVKFDSLGGSAVAYQAVERESAAAEPGAPVLEGAEFLGWHTDAEGKTAYGFDSPVTGNMTLYAKWDMPGGSGYLVKFDLRGGNAGGETVIVIRLPAGGAAEPPESPVKTGSRFAGWYKDADGKTAYAFGSPVKADITVYAKWEAYTYTVSFDRRDGAPPEIRTVDYGAAVERPEDPARAGRRFLGWYSGYAPYGFGSPVKADTLIYAAWSAGETFAAVLDDAADAGDGAVLYLESNDGAFDIGVTLKAGENSPVSLTIDGRGKTVRRAAESGENDRRPVTVGKGVILTLKDITFDKVPFDVADGGKLVLGAGTHIRNNFGSGVGILSGGKLEMGAGATVSYNNEGGVMLMDSDSEFTMNGGVIHNNSDAVHGGGVMMRDGRFTMNGGEIHSNTAQQEGGGVMASGEFTMNGGVIYGNTAANWNGGGVMIQNGDFTMNGGSISGNAASYLGGGVTAGGGRSTITVNGGSIHGNTAEYGGGVAMFNCSDGSKLDLKAGEIYGNRANGGDGGGVYADPRADTHAVFNMSGGRIRDNTSTWAGSGVYITNGTFNLTGGEIYANTSEHSFYHNGAAVVGSIRGSYVTGVADESRGSIRDNSPADVSE
jgi:uncharacterized repeat protein (TIGR02543 family)